jgi:hypothetical protein
MPERDADEPDTEPMSEVDAVRWLSARTLADVGELTALFLEGHLQQTPTHMGSPDTETIALIPVLAACNRTGFVTHQSQPGTPHDEHGGAQRANVSGYADSKTFARLMAAVADADLIITAPRALDGSDERDFGPFFAITLDYGEEFTWDGHASSRRSLNDSYDWVCHPAVIEALYEAWQVTLIDPEWGRNDVLWPALQKFTGR